MSDEVQAWLIGAILIGTLSTQVYSCTVKESEQAQITRRAAIEKGAACQACPEFSCDLVRK